MTPNVITSIETRYAGTTFRSRLEACWAVFFDLLQIPWTYEPECEFLQEGPYLPDFLLWDRLLVEVKPTLGELPALVEQYEKVIERTRGLPELLMLAGSPRVVWYPILTASMPCGFRWIDLERSSMKGEPVCLAGSRRPPVEDLVRPPTRFLAACLAAAEATFDDAGAP